MAAQSRWVFGSLSSTGDISVTWEDMTPDHKCGCMDKAWPSACAKRHRAQPQFPLLQTMPHGLRHMFESNMRRPLSLWVDRALSPERSMTARRSFVLTGSECLSSTHSTFSEQGGRVLEPWYQ